MSRLGLVLLLVALAAGCGDDAQCVLDSDCSDVLTVCIDQRCVPPGARDAGPRDAGDAGEGLDAGVDGGTDAGPPLRRTGSVLVMQTPLADPTTTPWSFTATFTVAPEDGRCTSMTSEGCTVTDCTVPAPPAPTDGGILDGGAGPDAGVVAAPQAGTIALTGGLMDLVLGPEADGLYAPRTGSGTLWNGGEELALGASGGEVPAFGAALVGPGQLSVTDPSFAAPPLTVDRATDFAVTWTGGSGTAHVILSNSEPTAAGTRTVQLDCAFDAAAATGVVPTALLELVPTGPGASLAIGTVSGDTVTAGDWTVTVAAATFGLADTGGGAVIAVTLTDSTP